MYPIIMSTLVLFFISIIIVSGYTLYMGSKKKQFPKMDFSRFKSKDINIEELEKLTNNAIKGVNGWMWLATLFTSLYYFMSFWSIALMALNLVISFLDVSNNYFSTLLILISLILYCFELWLNPKDKSRQYNKHWFDTSALTKEYIAKFSVATNIQELSNLVIEFNKAIHNTNDSVDFF